VSITAESEGAVPRYACLSFLTDYGLEDGFVAACHGVMARLAPGVPVIDVTHLVPPGDVRRGAAVLVQTLPYLPPGVHVGVVDPGVGTARRALALAAGSHLLVGPDNGLLPASAERLGGVTAAREITSPAAMLHPVSATFHGRDVFAPAAARLAAGALDLAQVGPEVDPGSLCRLPEPVVEVGDGYVAGEVLAVDRFGNVQTAVTASQLAAAGITAGARLRLEDSGRRVVFGETFGAVGEGELVAYVDSAGLLAVAVNGGDAAAVLGFGPGGRVRLRRG
jgi:S-adenosylmethionine hydrolase